MHANLSGPVMVEGEFNTERMVGAPGDGCKVSTGPWQGNKYRLTSNINNPVINIPVPSVFQHEFQSAVSNFPVGGHCFWETLFMFVFMPEN